MHLVSMLCVCLAEQEPPFFNLALSNASPADRCVHVNTPNYLQDPWVVRTPWLGKSTGANWRLNEQHGDIWGQPMPLRCLGFQRQFNVNVSGFHVGSLLPSTSTPYSLTFSFLSNWQWEPGKT